MKKITLLLAFNVFLILTLFNPIEVKANFVPGAFNSWTQNTPYSTTNMPAGYKKYTTQASDNNQFKLLMWNDNWTWGWGTNGGWNFNSWNTVWSVSWNTNIGNSTIQNFGTNQYMTIITSTSLSQATSKFGFLKTSATPINISSVSGGTSNVNTNSSVAINITLSGSKSSEEFVLIRYTTNNWSTSSFLTATGSGTSYSATIPGQAANTTVNWYAMTSTVATPSTDTDYLTLSVMNNSSSNYSYFTGESAATNYFRSKVTGNWNTAGTWESSSTGSSNWVTATLVPGSSAASITILNSHNITLDADVTVSGLTINSGATLTASDATPKTLTITKSTSGSASTLTNSGTWLNGSGGSTVVFTGAPSSGDAIHAISGTIAFQNLTINKTSGSSNVGASFGAGTSLTGTLEIGSGGFISTNPPTSFYGTGAILKFNQGIGATYDVNAGDKTWSTTEIPQNITVTSGKVRVNENRIATGSLIISADATLEVSAAKQLTVNTALTNNGTLSLKSTVDGTATILTPSSITGTGAYSVQQYLTSGRNWYVSSPVSAATCSTITSATGNTMLGYLESNASWPAAGTNLDIMKGYIVSSPSTNVSINFTWGTLNTGDKSIILRRQGATKVGFNLVGNPYPAYVNVRTAIRNTTNLEKSIWYRTKTGGTYYFDTYNVTSGFGTNNNGFGAVIGTIPPMQAFWVRANADNVTLSLNNSLCTHKTDTINPFKAPAQINTEQQIVRLQVSNGTNSDEAVVIYNANASNGYDDYDSPKMTNNDVAIPEIYTIAGTEQVVINGLNSVTLDEQMPLGFTTGSTNTFTIKATELTNFDADKRLILLDTQENTYQDLTYGSTYTFSSTPTTSSTRFKIVFKSAGVIAGLNNNANNSVIISTNENKQILINRGTELNNDGIVTVYNAVGQKLVSSTLSNSHLILSKPFNSGVYVVCVNIAGINTTKKVIIK